MEEFFARLKEHKLVQWALGYVAVSFALIPVVDVVAKQFGWPEAVLRGFIIALGTGFFITVVLAWYHGERGHGRILRTELAILVVLSVLGLLAIWRFAPTAPEPVEKTVAATVRHPAATTPAIPAKSIAVLPFENLSADKDNAYFSDGMQDLILTKLADIGDLKVISRTSTQAYGSHPQNLKQIGKELGVATLLEGSVQKAGDQVLINVQLIDARTDSHLWAQSYQRTLHNIFGVEGEVAQKVADALNARLSPSEAADVARIPTTNSTAYNAYVRGQYYENQMFGGHFELTPKAVAAYREATESDPTFALAWAKLAMNQSMLLYAVIDTSDKTRQQALANARHALKLEPDLPQGHLALGYVYRFDFAQYGKALAEFEIARQGLPNNADVESAIAYVQMTLGHPHAALTGLQRAATLDPRNPGTFYSIAIGLANLRQYDAAGKALQRALAIAPDDPEVHAVFSQLALLQRGDVSEASARLQNAPGAVQTIPDVVYQRVNNLLMAREFKAAQQAAATLKPGGRHVTALRVLTEQATVMRLAGDIKGAQAVNRRIIATAQAILGEGTGEDSMVTLGQLAIAQASVGERAAAMQTLAKVKDLATQKGLIYYLNMLSAVRARVDVLLGDPADAIRMLDQALAAPIGIMISAPLLKIDPVWDPLRKDPRFAALLKKYGRTK